MIGESVIGEVGKRFDLTGRTSLVTGAGQGLGRAISLGFAQHGASVAVVDIDSESASSVANEINGNGGKALALACDVTDENQVEETVRQAVDALGDIGILVANAGIGDRSPAERMTNKQWDRVLAVNLKGVWLFDHTVGIHMIEHGKGGSIINMGSIGGELGFLTGNANYSAAKGGVHALTRALAVEWARYGIRVNAIAPVQFKTALVLNLIKSKPETEKYFMDHIPLGRMGELEDIVGPAVFLASGASAMVTGTTLRVDGASSVAF